MGMRSCVLMYDVYFFGESPDLKRKFPPWKAGLMIASPCAIQLRSCSVLTRWSSRWSYSASRYEFFHCGCHRLLSQLSCCVPAPPQDIQTETPSNDALLEGLLHIVSCLYPSAPEACVEELKDELTQLQERYVSLKSNITHRQSTFLLIYALSDLHGAAF